MSAPTPERLAEIRAMTKQLVPEHGRIAISQLLELIAAQEAKIETAREALEDIGTTAHCISKAGPVATRTLEEAWGKFDHISAKATSALAALAPSEQTKEKA